MHLLYCSVDGIVIVLHKDSEAVVPMWVYENVVRIIPYDQSVGLLPKYGSPPPPPPPLPASSRPIPDLRPYMQPDPTPAILKLYAAQVRFNRSNDGFHFMAASGDIPVWTDRNSYYLLSGLATWAATVTPETPVNFTQGGTAYPITAAECIAMFGEFTTLIQDGRNIEAECLADLDSGAPTILSYEDVDARFAGSLRSAGETARRPWPFFAPTASETTQ